MAGRRVGESARRFALASTLHHHHQFLRTDIDTAYVALVQGILQALGWFRLPDPESSPVELAYAGLGLRFSSALWRRGRGADLKLRLWCEHPALRRLGLRRNMLPIASCSLPCWSTYKRRPHAPALKRIHSKASVS